MCLHMHGWEGHRAGREKRGEGEGGRIGGGGWGEEESKSLFFTEVEGLTYKSLWMEISRLVSLGA